MQVYSVLAAMACVAAAPGALGASIARRVAVDCSNPAGICTAEYNPQCGTDGVTYGNPCNLGYAQCKDNTLQLMFQGECLELSDEQKQCIKDKACEVKDDKVCGSDGVTYGNACVLEAMSSCVADEKSLTKKSDGECPFVTTTDATETATSAAGTATTTEDATPTVTETTSDVTVTIPVETTALPMETATTTEDATSAATETTSDVTATPPVETTTTTELTVTEPIETPTITDATTVTETPTATETSTASETPTATEEPTGGDDCLNTINCPFIEMPVCGSDGVTYPNICVLEANKKCKSPSLRKVSDGMCPNDCLSQIPCTLDYRPVCGSDGQTYDNNCRLEAVRTCVDPKLRRVSEGECPPTPQQCLEGIPCILIYAPVCASSGDGTMTTFGNKCQFDATKKCVDPTLKIRHEGECKVDCAKPVVCTFDYSPVCANNGKTYGNKCAFTGAKCDDPSLEIVKEGECPTGCGAPKNVKVWIGEPYVLGDNTTWAAQVSASWHPVAAAEGYYLCVSYKTENGTYTDRVCRNVPNPENEKAKTVTWNNGFQIFTEGANATDILIRVRARGTGECKRPYIHAALQTSANAKFTPTCNATLTNATAPVSSIAIDYSPKEETGDDSVSLDIVVNKTAEAVNVTMWEGCVASVIPDKNTTEYRCKYIKNINTTEFFAWRYTVPFNELTSEYVATVRALGDCAPPAESDPLDGPEPKPKPETSTTEMPATTQA